MVFIANFFTDFSPIYDNFHSLKQVFNNLSPHNKFSLFYSLKIAQNLIFNLLQLFNMRSTQNQNKIFVYFAESSMFFTPKTPSTVKTLNHFIPTLTIERFSKIIKNKIFIQKERKQKQKNR